MKSTDKVINGVSYNIAAANEMSEADWIKNHEHHGATAEHFKELQVEKPTEKAEAKKAPKG